MREESGRAAAMGAEPTRFTVAARAARPRGGRFSFSASRTFRISDSDSFPTCEEVESLSNLKTFV